MSIRKSRAVAGGALSIAVMLALTACGSDAPSQASTPPADTASQAQVFYNFDGNDQVYEKLVIEGSSISTYERVRSDTCDHREPEFYDEPEYEGGLTEDKTQIVWTGSPYGNDVTTITITDSAVQFGTDTWVPLSDDELATQMTCN